MQHGSHKNRRFDIGETARENTWPLALIGVGLGWMLLSGARETESYGKASRWTGGKTQGLRGRMNSSLSSVRDRADDLRHRATSRWSKDEDDTAAGYDRIADYDARDDQSAYGESAYGNTAAEDYSRGSQGGGITDRARGMLGGAQGRAAEANSSFWDMVEEHPMMAGIMGLALGAAIGATLPSTRTEDEWLGAYRDRLMDDAWQRGQDTLDQAGQVARDAARAGAQAAKETAQREAGDLGLTGEGRTEETADAGGGSPGGGTRAGAAAKPA